MGRLLLAVALVSLAARALLCRAVLVVLAAVLKPAAHAALAAPRLLLSARRV